MRPELLNPVANQRKLKRAVELAKQLYKIHEAGRDYSRERAELSDHVGRPISAFDLDAAFGSVDAKTFAEGLLPADVPDDLTHEEMLDMIHRICKAIGKPSQHNYWLHCLAANTRDDRISDLIFWPDHYFGDGNLKREMTPQQILDTALASGRKNKPA